jgi:tetratricopeptide (TPR) repeat protein
LFEECIEAGRLALNIDQDHPEAVELVRLASERLTRNRRLQELKKVAEKALNTGNLGACLEAAEEGLALDPTNAELAGLQERASQEIERQAEIDRLLSEANSRYAKQDYHAAVATLARLLQLDPDNTGAERLKGQAESAADRKERLEALTAEIAEAKNRQDHRAVVELCSAALELDPENQALSQIRTEAEEALKKRAGAEKLLRQAQKFYQQKNYEEASNLAGQAVEVDPELTEATRLQASAREALRQVEMESFLQNGTELFEQGRYQDAAEVCRAGLRLDAKDSRLLDLTRQVEAALERQAETRKILATAEEFLVAKRWAEAAEAANLILDMDPNNSRAIEIRELSSDQLDRAERLQMLYERASRQRSVGAWQECLETCQEALRQAPEDANFQALHAGAVTELEKGQKIASLLSAAQSAFRNSDLERALSLVGEAESLAGETNETRTLALKLQEAIGLQERVKEKREQATEAFSAGEYQRAVQLAEEGLSLQPSAPELKTIQSEAKQALDRQEKLQGILDKAGAALAKGQFDKASSLALSALQLDPHSSSARDLLGKAEQLADEAVREAKLKGIREAALKEFKNGAFQRSLELCSEGLLLSDAPDLKDLRLKSEQAIQERVAHIARLLEEGDKAFKSGNLERAVQFADGVLKIDPENQQAHSLEKAARAAINEQERRARVKRFLTEARKARQNSDALKCHQAATEALALDPDNAELAQLRQWASDLLEKERLEQERASRIKESWDSARAALKRKRYRSVVRTLDLLLSLDSDNREAKELREEALLAAAARRKQRIRFTSYGAGAVLSISLVVLGLWSASNLAWNGGQQVGAEPSVTMETVVTPSAAPEMDANSQFLEGLLSDARKHLSSKDFDQAAQLATQALDLSEQHPDAQEILSQARESLAAVEDGKQAVRSLIRQGRADQALTRLNQVLRLAPADPEAVQLSQQLDRQGDAKNTADAARREMAQSRASAQKDATSLTDLLGNAAAAEKEADRLYVQGQFAQAAGKFYEARDGYDEAVREAAFREQQRIADARRAVNQARDDFEQNRQRAEQAGAPDGAADLFRQANDLAVRAARKATGNDFAGAQNDYQQATRLLSQAVESAAATRRQEERQRQEEQTRQRAAAAQRNVQETASRAKQEAEDTLAGLADTAPAASQELSGAAALYGQGRWEEATDAYGRATSKLRAMQQERSKAALALDTFISAYSSQDLRTLKSVWPTMDGSTENQFRKAFADSRAIEIRFEPSSIRLDGDSATAIGSVFLKVTPIRGESMETGSESARFQLQRRGESWVISSVQLNIGQ